MAQVKRIRRNVSGIILLDKPLGFTSNAALQKVRWLLNAEKAGHTGSLDPLATGVLPLCFGEAASSRNTCSIPTRVMKPWRNWARPPPRRMPKVKFCWSAR